MAENISFDRDPMGSLSADHRRPVAKNRWHTLKVEFAGRSIGVAMDSKVYIVKDDHIGGAGAVGMWTKANSVTVFDDFIYNSGAKR